MSDINYSLSYRIAKDGLANSIQVSNVTATMGVAGFKSLTYALTTNDTVLQTANLASIGMAFLQNLATATAATAQLGISPGGSFVGFATLRPGESALVRLSSGTDYVMRGAAGARVRVDISEG
jgi:hypothetical protein